MRTFKSYLYKEHIEAIKQSKYIILAVGIIIFAILDPLMLKMLPMFIQSQANVEIPQNAISGTFAVKNYIKDLHQIGFIFVIFSFAGTLLSEIKNQRLMLPYSKGAVPSEIVYAKIAHYFGTVAVLTLAGLIINYFYVWFIFGKPSVEIWSLFYTFIFIMFYYSFFLSLTLFLSSIFKKTTSVGITILLFSYFLGFVSLFWAKGSKYLPGQLIDGAYNYEFSGSWYAIFIALAVITTMVYLSVLRMNRVEVN